MLEWHELRIGDYIKVVFLAKKKSYILKVVHIGPDFAILKDADDRMLYLLASGIATYFPKDESAAHDLKKCRLFKAKESDYLSEVI